jgi:hypothetical protein
MQYHLHEDGNILSIRMPVCFKRRSSRKMIIAPSGAGALLNNGRSKISKARSVICVCAGESLSVAGSC